MNETNTPEPLAAILAEMRNDNIPRIEDEAVIRCMLHNLADRIEAAAKREYAEAKDYFAKLHDGPSMICTATNCAVRNIGLSFAAPGNAAAMRAALKRCDELFRCDNDNRARLCSLARKADEATQAALAAPARNCDRFEDADVARDAVKAAFANTMLLDDIQLRAVCDWLFDPAKGGDHA